MRTDIAEICCGVHHAQLCRKSLSYTSKLKPKHRWWKYTIIFRSMQFSLLSHRVSPLKLIPNTKIYRRMATYAFCHYWPWKVMSKLWPYSYGCNRSLRRKTIHRLLASILTVLLIVLNYGNFLSWHNIAGMDELLYFFFGWSVESYNSFVQKRSECRSLHLPTTANELCDELCVVRIYIVL